jgi:hypothetical protein
MDERADPWRDDWNAWWSKEGRRRGPIPAAHESFVCGWVACHKRDEQLRKALEEIRAEEVASDRAGGVVWHIAVDALGGLPPSADPQRSSTEEMK